MADRLRHHSSILALAGIQRWPPTGAKRFALSRSGIVETLLACEIFTPVNFTGPFMVSKVCVRLFAEFRLVETRIFTACSKISSDIHVKAESR